MHGALGAIRTIIQQELVADQQRVPGCRLAGSVSAEAAGAATAHPHGSVAGAQKRSADREDGIALHQHIV